MRRRYFLSSCAPALGFIALPGLIRARTRSAGAGAFGPAILQLAHKLENDYVVPATGARYAAMLRANLDKGGYADAADAGQLANRLTAELKSVSADGHLRVVTEGGAKPRQRRAERALPETKWLADGVAYLRFEEFSGSARSVAAVADFMRDHATAHALIIDARDLPGGGMDEMNVMFPYLFARETTLVAMDVAQRFVDERGPPPGSGAGLRVVAAPPGVFRREHFVLPHATERRWFDAQVFCLTSDKTASAGEHMVLALKRTKRGTVVGGRTAGGNHFGDFEALGHGLSAFIPVGRTIDPDTGEDWEGVGIAPDVEVAAELALQEALRLAGSQRELKRGGRAPGSPRSASR